MIAFAWWERRAADPVVDLRLFTHRAFTAGTLIAGLQNFTIYALLFELPVVFSRGFCATPAQSGRALPALTLAMVAGSMLGGRVAGVAVVSTLVTDVAFQGGANSSMLRCCAHSRTGISGCVLVAIPLCRASLDRATNPGVISQRACLSSYVP